MKAKKSIKYLFFTILIFFVILFKGHIEQLNRLYFEKAFNLNFFYLVINLLISMSIGVIFGLKHIMREVRKEGKWVVDFPKLIVIGCPLLFISLYHIWIYCDVQFSMNILVYGLGRLSIFGLSASSVSLFQLIFGYIAITSFYKNSSVS